MKIAVLSLAAKLYSTSRLLEEIKKAKHQALLINYVQCNIYISTENHHVRYKNKVIKDVDAIIPRISARHLFHGASVVRQFESNNVYSVNESQAIVRSKDKLRSLQLLSRAGIPVPKTIFARTPRYKDIVQLIEVVGGPPVIIKFVQGTQGMGVILAPDIKSAVSMIESLSNLQVNILIQEYIKESAGKDIRAFVVGDRVCAAMMRKSTTKDFRANIHKGAIGTPINLSQEEEILAVKSAKILGLNIAGVDMLISNDGLKVVEVNSSPGLKGIESATKKNIAKEIVDFTVKQVLLGASTKDQIGI